MLSLKIIHAESPVTYTLQTLLESRDPTLVAVLQPNFQDEVIVDDGELISVHQIYVHITRIEEAGGNAASPALFRQALEKRVPGEIVMRYKKVGISDQVVIEITLDFGGPCTTQASIDVLNTIWGIELCEEETA